MAPDRSERLCDRAVAGNRIRGRFHGAKLEIALRVRTHAATAALFGVRVLHVIQAGAVGMPYFQHGAGNRRAVDAALPRPMHMVHSA